MLDARARRALAPALDSVGRRLGDAGLPPLVLTGLGWLVGVGACVAAAGGRWWLAALLWLANRLLDGLDGPVARRRGASDLGGFLDVTADFSIYAGFVIAVAVAEPYARLACLTLLGAYYVSGTALLALSSLLERRAAAGGPAKDERSLRFAGGLAEGTETVVVYLLFCLFPGHAGVIAWAFAVAVGITAAQRLWLGVTALRLPARAVAPSPTLQTLDA